MATKGRVLVWADDLGWRKTLSWLLGEVGLEVACGASESHALELACRNGVDAIVMDSEEYCVSDRRFVQQMEGLCPGVAVIVVSPRTTAPETMGGDGGRVCRYLRRPEDLEQLGRTVLDVVDLRSAAANGQGEGETSGVRSGAAMSSGGPKTPDAARVLIGETECVRRARDLAAQVAPSDMTVLIRGESGTGKDVVARLIHTLSPRAATGSFVKINCPAIPETLLESELFGYEKGAFTGAVSQKPGRFELAEGGTIFLDEIGLMSPAMQSKLLDVIEQKQFVRVGGKGVTRVDVRIIAATNAPLEKMIEEGAFRADLFYRLRQFSINLAPLRSRAEDVPRLCDHFLQQCASKVGFRFTQLPPELMPNLIRYQWPGNVRELEAIIARYALCGDAEALMQAIAPQPHASELASDDKLETIERTTILACLAECRWNRRHAASTLGISYSALRRRMTKYGIDHPVLVGNYR